MGMSVASIPHARACIMDVNRTTLEDVAVDTISISLSVRGNTTAISWPECHIRNTRSGTHSAREHLAECTPNALGTGGE
jgi:hypothetical protein